MIAKGKYKTETIKYFRADVILLFQCPLCGLSIDINAADGFIEYPEEKMTRGDIECDCGAILALEMQISMPVEIEYEVKIQEAPM